MYVGHVNWLIMECRVVKNASTEGDICDKVVETSRGASGARGLVGGADSDDDSFDPKDTIRPKNRA